MARTMMAARVVRVKRTLWVIRTPRSETILGWGVWWVMCEERRGRGAYAESSRRYRWVGGGDEGLTGVKVTAS
jgi:hypothetical protein